MELSKTRERMLVEKTYKKGYMVSIDYTDIWESKDYVKLSNMLLLLTNWRSNDTIKDFYTLYGTNTIIITLDKDAVSPKNLIYYLKEQGCKHKFTDEIKILSLELEMLQDYDYVEVVE